MRLRVSAVLAIAVLCLAPTASWADLAPYSQDFEGLVQADPAALANDGWLVFGNVFDPGGGYLYGYGPFPAPNGGPAFSAIDAGQGGPSQGAQQLSVYSDYNNGDHGVGNLIEANVFQEQTIGAADVGNLWVFAFDAKRGNIEGATTAMAFIKTLDPAAGFALTNFITVDMTAVPTTWGSYSTSIFIDPSLDGQILQIGFLSTATNYESSGVFYDNIAFDAPAVVIPTLSEWGLIVMSLLFLSAGTILFCRRRAVVSGGGGSASMTVGNQPLFVPGLFIRVLGATLALVVAALATATALTGEWSAVDLTGSLMSAPVLAYVVHLWIAWRRH